MSADGVSHWKLLAHILGRGIFVRGARAGRTAAAVVHCRRSDGRAGFVWLGAAGKGGAWEGAGFPRGDYSRIGDIALGARRNLYPPS